MSDLYIILDVQGFYRNEFEGVYENVRTILLKARRGEQETSFSLSNVLTGGTPVSKEELSEERKQAKKIIERWQSRGISMFVVYICVPSSFTSLISCGGITLWKIALFTILSGFWCFYALKYMGRSNKIFLGGLSLNELQRIEEIARSTDKGEEQLKQQAENILKQYKSIYYKEETELLRASKPTGDNTLLRPTTGKDETPKEELLRAVQNEEA